MTTRARVVVTGRVQGVFFRVTCAERARGLGLGGRVGNLPDGSVEAVFEGSETAVGAMVDWCRTGPPLSRVEHVEVAFEEPVGDVGFRVTG